MKFSELDEPTKNELRDKHRHDRVSADSWWDAVYEDCIRVADCLGLRITADDMHFSGFASQGDGACFKGAYTYKPDAVNAIKEHAPQDTVLHSIAQDLQDLHTSNPILVGPDGCQATISQSGRYCHSGTMTISATNGHGDDLVPELETKLLEIIRRFADWHYKQLEQEYEYLTSDQSVDELLEDRDFVQLSPGQEAIPSRAPRPL